MPRGNAEQGACAPRLSRDRCLCEARELCAAGRHRCHAPPGALLLGTMDEARAGCEQPVQLRSMLLFYAQLTRGGCLARLSQGSVAQASPQPGCDQTRLSRQWCVLTPQVLHT